MRTVRNSSRLPGGVPARGVYLPGGVPARGVYLPGGCTCLGGTCPGVYLLGGVPARGCTCWRVYLPGGYLPGGYLPRGCTCLGAPAPGVPAWGHLLRGVPALGGGRYLPRYFPLWTEWLTDRCKNIAFTTSLRTVTKPNRIQWQIKGCSQGRALVQIFHFMQILVKINAKLYVGAPRWGLVPPLENPWCVTGIRLSYVTFVLFLNLFIFRLIRWTSWI